MFKPDSLLDVVAFYFFSTLYAHPLEAEVHTQITHPGQNIKETTSSVYSNEIKFGMHVSNMMFKLEQYI